MKDARGRSIKVGDVIVYATMGGVECVNAARVTEVAKRLKAEVVSNTEYGTIAGKTVTIGNGHDLLLQRVMVVESGGKPVDLAGGRIRRWDSKDE